MRRRFFVDKFEGDQAHLLGERAHHLGKVLRAQPGQIYELSDGEKVRLGTIDRVERNAIAFMLGDEIPVPELRLEVALLLAIVKFDRFEWALEKATELGVGQIVPLIAERSEKALIAAAAKRSERWNRIALESAQQSRRLKAPVIEGPAEVALALRDSNAAVKLLLSENPEAQLLRNVVALKPNRDDVISVSLAIGPEGGWTEKEFASARESGFDEVSLGRTILRTETAVTAALASINYAFGD